MRAVKPYYIGDYKKRIIGELARLISMFIATTKRKYRIMPFLPVVLFAFYPLFFNVKFSDFTDQPLLQHIIALIPLELIMAVSLMWWIFCTDNFNIKKLFEGLNPIKAYKEDGFSFSIFVFVMDILFACSLPLFSVIGAGCVILISKLIMALSSNETTNFYIATLPLALGLSYTTLLELNKKRGE